MATISVACETESSFEFLRHVSETFPLRDISVRAWDGNEIGPSNGSSVATLVLNHPGSLRCLMWPFNKSAAGEAYIFGDIDIEGDIEAVLKFLIGLRKHLLRRSPTGKIALFRKILGLPKQANERPARGAAGPRAQHSEERDKQAVQYHYDGPPSEFYALFLGERMQYSCGYWKTPKDDVDDCQSQKLDHICRKLQLKPGDRLLDVGCGWGGLITYAAKYYGVEAVGVSIAENQIAWARRRIEREGLGDRCRVEFSDYRNISETAQFDKAVSVGFIEHLGLKSMPTFLNKVQRLLKPGGLYLHHGITMRPFAKYPPWRQFALKYVFPDGELVTIDETVRELGRAELEVRDVESLREHYAHTLRRWREGLEANYDEAKRLTDEITYRIYRIYFAGAALGFLNATYNLHQVLSVKSGHEESRLPLTRDAWYRNEGSR